MPCREYATRPRICREFSCGKPCVHCGGCCANIVMALGGQCADKEFLELHGAHVAQNPDNYALVIPAPCRHYYIAPLEVSL